MALSAPFGRSPHPSRMHSTSGLGREVMGREASGGGRAAMYTGTRGGGGGVPEGGASPPMMGMTGEDLLGGVELLQQHATHQERRPGQRPQRQARVGALDARGAQPLGAAD